MSHLSNLPAGVTDAIHEEWPIRIGGVYQLQSYENTFFRVTEICGEKLFGHVQAKFSDGSLKDCGGARDIGPEIFREIYLPEDQSPIPSLIAALERIVSDFEMNYVLDGVVVDDPSTAHRHAWEVASAALANAKRGVTHATS